MLHSLPNITVRLPPGSISSPSKKKLAPIIGGVFGAIAALVLFSVGILFYCRRRRKQGVSGDKPVPEAYVITPFTEEIRPLMPEAMGPTSSTSQTSLSAFLTPDIPPKHPRRMHTFAMEDSKEPRSSVEDSMRGSSVIGSTRRMETSTSHNDDLRREVEQLRMEMEALKGQQSRLADEPPPSYT